MNPSTLPSCPKCGQLIPKGAPQGLCPRCLMLGVAEPTQPSPLGTVLPTRDEIAQAFPAYEVGGMIGHGGMGAVFRVRQRKLERDVALKILPRALAADPAFAERFHREARALAKLNHPNIVTIHDFGEQGGWYFLLMELVDGVNLRQAMRTKRFTPEQALEIVPKICEALQYAHGEGVLHRDIKPENLLLDSKGRIKIADFGIAKLGRNDATEISLTLSGASLGTVAYMAPEQIEHPSEVDHRADIYSLGVVFYEMLTGELPIGRFAAPSEKSPVNTQVDEVVFRTLEKERERRYQSAGEMKTHVETLVGQVPSAPPAVMPPPPEAQPAIPPKRFRGPGAALGWIVFGILASLSFTFSFRSQNAEQQRVALTAQMEAEVAAASTMNGQPVPAPSAAVSSMQESTSWVIAGPVLIVTTALPILLGILFGWKNVCRLRTADPPRRGLIPASIAALILPFCLLWAAITANIRDEPLAWFDAITLTAILLIWFCAWMNPRPLPWSAKAVLGATFALIPLLFLAHGWRGYHEDITIAWAQEMNYLQEDINQATRILETQSSDRILPNLQQLNHQMQELHSRGKPSNIPALSSDVRACFVIAALFAVASSLLGWMARAELLQPPQRQRGLGLAKLAAYFWPLAILPLLLLLMA